MKKTFMAHNAFTVTPETTTFPTPKKNIKTFFLEEAFIGSKWKLPGIGTFQLTKDNYNEVIGLIQPTMLYSDNCFIYNSKLAKLGLIPDETEEKEDTQISQFQRVRNWATVRGLYEKGDSKTQFVKLIEEIGETGRAILKSDEPEIKDGLGDSFVVLVNLAHLCGYTLEECVEAALEVIEARTGKMVNGTFIKDE